MYLCVCSRITDVCTQKQCREHFVNLTGRGQGEGAEAVAVIDEDGSPQASRVFGLWHPSLPVASATGDAKEGVEAAAAAAASGVKEKEGVEEAAAAVALKKRSPYKDTARLLAELVQRGLKTLVFVKVCPLVYIDLTLTYK
jgi:ATP-dependent helicase YprA (DUF1998 family)